MITSGYMEVVDTLETRVLFELAKCVPHLQLISIEDDFPSDSEGAVQFSLADTRLVSAMWEQPPMKPKGNAQFSTLFQEHLTQFVKVQIATKDYSTAIIDSHKIVNHFIKTKAFSVTRVGNFNDSGWSKGRAGRNFTFEIVSQDFCEKELIPQEIRNETISVGGLNATTLSKAR